jgi:pectate lyase
MLNMRLISRVSALAFLVGLCVPAGATPPAFPGAEGFGAVASGGRGGQVIYVTSLAADPNGQTAGTLNWALRQTGARTILFKVSGVIHAAANLVHGDVTIAGQTSPGGIIVRGLICDGHYEQNSCDNVIVRHLATRPAWNLPLPGGGERLDDGLRLDGIHAFIFDHISVANAADEAIQISWASDGTIQYSTLGETVGDHADRGGMLINYSVAAKPQNRLSVHHNLWYRIGGRLPEITCEASALPGNPGETADCLAHPLQLEVSMNLVHDPGFTLWYNRDVDQNSALGPYRVQFNYVGNRWQTRADFPYGMLLHDLLDVSTNELYVSGNTMSRYAAYADYQLFYCCNDFPGNVPNTGLGSATRRASRHAFPAIDYDTTGLAARIESLAGRLPHDPQSRRYAANARSVVYSPSSYEVAEADDAFDLDFDPASPPAAPVDSDNDGMPDSFEQRYAALGLNPGVFDANAAQLSVPFTGVNGYTNLECYLNWLADQRLAEADRIFGSSLE